MNLIDIIDMFNEYPFIGMCIGLFIALILTILVITGEFYINRFINNILKIEIKKDTKK